MGFALPALYHTGRGGGGVSVRRGLCPSGVSVWGVSQYGGVSVQGVSVLGGLCLEGLCLCLPSLKSLESVVLHTYTESLFVYAESIWCSDQSIIGVTDFKISGENSSCS